MTGSAMTGSAMTRIRGLLVLLLVAELVGTAVFVGWHWSRPSPPSPDLSRLPRSTAVDLQRLWEAAEVARPDAWREVGEAFLSYGYFVEAEVCLRHAATLDPNDFAAAYGRAYSLDRMGRTREAGRHFETASRLANPDNFRSCLYQLARNHLREEDAVAAERAFALIDKFPAADHQRAHLLVSLGREAEARSLIVRLEKAYPDDVNVQLLMMEAERSAGHDAVAAEHADRAERSFVRLRLSDHWAYLHPIRSRYGLHAALARVEAANNAGKLIDAALQFEAIVQATDPEYLLDKLAIGADLELRAGRPHEAHRLLQLLSDRMAMQPTALHLLGDALLGLGQTQKAREAWERANKLRSRSESHARLAALWEQEGDSARAVREHGLARQVAGIQAFRQNQLPQALQLLEQAVRLAPREAQAWFYLGEVRRLLAQPSAAVDAYQQCVALCPEHGRALTRLQ